MSSFGVVLVLLDPMFWLLIEILFLYFYIAHFILEIRIQSLSESLS